MLEAQETARDSLEEVRRIARKLRPEALDDLGLASALHVLGERVAEHSELEVDVHVQPGLPEFGGDAELVLYRVAQEALTNVARHAGARRAEVRLELSGGRPRLEVDDDGAGFPRSGLEGGGVRGMRERAVLIGATLRLGPSPLGGARVTLELPRHDHASTPASCSPTTTRSSAAACGSCSRASRTCASSPRPATAPRRSSAG